LRTASSIQHRRNFRAAINTLALAARTSIQQNFFQKNFLMLLNRTLLHPI